MLDLEHRQRKEKKWDPKEKTKVNNDKIQDVK
jgi:hypothetical protein